MDGTVHGQEAWLLPATEHPFQLTISKTISFHFTMSRKHTPLLFKENSGLLQTGRALQAAHRVGHGSQSWTVITTGSSSNRRSGSFRNNVQEAQTMQLAADLWYLVVGTQLIACACLSE